MQQPNIYQDPKHDFHQRMTGNPTTEALKQYYPNYSPCTVCGNVNQLYTDFVEIFMHIFNVYEKEIKFQISKIISLWKMQN